MKESLLKEPDCAAFGERSAGDASRSAQADSLAS